MTANEKISHWLIKSRQSKKIIGFGAEILKDDKYEWILETYINEAQYNQIILRLIFENLELQTNPEIINFNLNQKLAKNLIKSLKKQLREIKRKKKHSKKRGKSKK